jgi:hypothetical protein
MDKFNKLPTGLKIVIGIVVLGIIAGTIFGVPVNENL